MFEKLNKSDWYVLKTISQDPYKKFHLREISKLTNLSPSSVKTSLDLLKKNDLIIEERLANLRRISANSNNNILKQFKVLTNVEFIEPAIKKLLPANTIVLFGSFAKGENDKDSDIDILIITNKKEKTRLTEIKGFPLQIIYRTPAQWNKMKENDEAFVDEIRRGIVLKGEMP